MNFLVVQLLGLLSLSEGWVESLVGDLRSHKLCSAARKKQNKTKTIFLCVCVAVMEVLLKLVVYMKLCSLHERTNYLVLFFQKSWGAKVSGDDDGDVIVPYSLIVLMLKAAYASMIKYLNDVRSADTFQGNCELLLRAQHSRWIPSKVPVYSKKPW